jgi:cytochrome c-type biogenesis protein CcmH
MGAPLVVAVVALTIASFHTNGSSAAQRVAAIESVVKCPACKDVSVAQSEETTALAVRHEIAHDVAAGQSTGQIEQTLISQYGPTILLVPPDTGGFSLIWVVPIVLGLGSVVTVAVFFWRRSRQFGSMRAEQAT